MPYRRLPNTDQARVRTLKAAVRMMDTDDVYALAASLKTLTEARNFLLKFEGAQQYYTECYERQAKAGRQHRAHVKMARLFVSHFIQVLNLAAVRQEVRREYLSFYGLDRKNCSVPDLVSEASLVEWGRKIIDGESRRLSQGGSPIYNPAIAKVRVHYDIFVDSYEKQKNLQALTSRSLEQLAGMRAEADKLILDIWNQVERRYADVMPLQRRLELCRQYGIIYYYRTGEEKTV